MNWNKVEGNWTIFKGKVREKWGKLTDDQVEQMKGKADRLVVRFENDKVFLVITLAAILMCFTVDRNTIREVGEDIEEGGEAIHETATNMQN
jgi:predicted small secreted protein